MLARYSGYGNVSPSIWMFRSSPPTFAVGSGFSPCAGLLSCFGSGFSCTVGRCTGGAFGCGFGGASTGRSCTTLGGSGVGGSGSPRTCGGGDTMFTR